MSGLDQIAVTGAPGLVSALGIGTVFMCLVILFLIMILMGRIMPRLGVSRRVASSPGNARGQTPATAAPESDAEMQEPSRQSETAAAVAVALVRHRKRKTSRPVEEETTGNAWKMAGRLNAMKKL